MTKLLDIFSDPIQSLDWDDSGWYFRKVSNQFPFCDIWFDKEQTLHFNFSLAGYTKEKLSIELDRGNLIISHPGIIINKDIKDINYYHKSIKTSGFERVFKLEDIYVNSTPEAEFKEGILHISIKRDENMKKKSIIIK